MASIQKRKGKNGRPVYFVRIRTKGQYLSGKFFSRAEAEQWTREVESDLQRQRTLGGAIARYSREDLKGRAVQVQKQQAQQLEFWLSKLGDVPVSGVTAADIAKAGEASWKPATADNYLSTLSQIFRSAVRWGWVNSNPVANVARSGQRSVRERVLSGDEQTRLVAACRRSSNPYLYPIVLIALATGARKEELRTLAWSQVDFRKELIYVCSHGSGGSRFIPLFGEALEVMRELSAKKKPGNTAVFSFSSRREGPGRFQTRMGNCVGRCADRRFPFQ